MTGSFNGLGRGMNIAGYVKQWTNAGREEIAELGLTADFYAHRTVSALENQSDVGLGRWGMAADGLMRISGLAPHTIASRQVTAFEYHVNISKAVATGEINEKMARTFKRYGIDKRTLNAWKNAPRIEVRGVSVIDINALPPKAQSQYRGLINEEVDTAIPTPGVRERVYTNLATDPNTAAGAVALTATQFMSHPVTMFTKHFNRILQDAHMKPAERFTYIGLSLASLTAMGGVSVIAKDLAAGKEITGDYLTSPEFFYKALLQGGYLNVVGDLLFKEGGFAGVFKSPTTDGAMQEVLGVLVFGNIQKITSMGWSDYVREQNFSVEVIDALLSITPGVNLWYTRLLLERGLTDGMKNLADPRYKQKQKQKERKMQKEEGRGMWY